VRFLADQDVYASTVAFLVSLGHDVQTAESAGLHAAADQEILEHCLQSGRTLVTRDKDFGNLVIARGVPSRGVILMRGTPLRLADTHRQLRAALSTLPSLEGIFLVIEETRYRFRRF
jgi:predicted nuclease of predicted toxin-antitoxin system